MQGFQGMSGTDGTQGFQGPHANDFQYIYIGSDGLLPPTRGTRYLGVNGTINGDYSFTAFRPVGSIEVVEVLFAISSHENPLNPERRHNCHAFCIHADYRMETTPDLGSHPHTCQPENSDPIMQQTVHH